LGGKSERLLPPIAKQPQDVIGDVITVNSWTVHNRLLEKSSLNPFVTTFATICPFPEEYIKQAIRVWFLFSLSCNKSKVVHEGEREIRPRWPAIYTFLGRGKWWQKAAVCGLRFANSKLPFCFLLFTLWLRLLPCADVQISRAYFQYANGWGECWAIDFQDLVCNHYKVHLVAFFGVVLLLSQTGYTPQCWRYIFYPFGCSTVPMSSVRVTCAITVVRCKPDHLYFALSVCKKAVCLLYSCNGL
jgi:hypothetical protein